MTRDERDDLKQHINSELDVRDVAERIAGLKPDKAHGYVCPKCNSGSGPHGTGLHHYPDTNRLHCFACDYSYGPIDLLMVATGDDYNAALQMGAEALGVDWHCKPADRPQVPKVRRVERTERPQPHEPASPLPDYSEYLARAREALTDDSDGAKYLAGRGLRLKAAQQCGIGYDAQTHRIIVPTDNGGYVARSANGANPKVLNPKGVPIDLSFGNALDGPDPVHITEGWADALAIIGAGGAAVSLNSTSNVNKLIQRLDRMESVPPLILALDLDDAGRQTRNKLAAYLDKRDLRYADSTVYEATNDNPEPDPAESLERVGQPEFAERVRHDKRAASIDPEADAFAGSGAGMRAFTHTYHYRLLRGTPRISTGIDQLDAQLGGGLHAGLFVLAGTTGAGKTTMAVNIADNICRAGRHVLYIALEMSAAELYAKSLARIAYDIATDQGCPNNAPSFGTMLDNGTHDNPYGTQAAFRYMETIADRMHIYEAVGHAPASTVRKLADMVMQAQGVAPIVIVDYLQLMGADDERLTDKQAADKNVMGLKQLSRDLDTPVLALSSLNRASYAKKDEGDVRVSVVDLKETGGIEFSSDMVLALERTDHHGPLADPRDVQLCILKNRRGIRHAPTGYRFYGGHCLYVPYPAAVRQAQSDEELDDMFKVGPDERIF